MPSYTLTTTWQRVALAGMVVKLQGYDQNPSAVMSGASAPAPADRGIEIGYARSGETLVLTQDLWARAANATPLSTSLLNVLDGIRDPTPQSGGTDFSQMLDAVTPNGDSARTYGLLNGWHMWSTYGTFAGATLTLQRLQPDGATWANLTRLDGSSFSVTAPSDVPVPVGLGSILRTLVAGATGTYKIGSAIARLA